MKTIHNILMIVFFVAAFWFVWAHIAADLPSDFLARFVRDAKKKGGE
jgi:hypothetical protein